MEDWVSVVGYEGVYEVSDCGNVRRVAYSDNASKSHHELLKNMKFRKDRFGYLTVKLMRNGNAKVCRVHRLVAGAFIKNPEGYPQVNHLDGNKENNHVNNLEWCTAKHNVQHAVSNELRNLKNKKGSMPVGQYSLSGELIATYPSAHEAARQNSAFAQTHIHGCCNGKSRQHKGFVWQYVNADKPIEKLDNVEFLLHSEPRAKKVFQRTMDGELVGVFPSATYAAKACGLHQAAINRCCNKKAKHHAGFLWSYD